MYHLELTPKSYELKKVLDTFQGPQELLKMMVKVPGAPSSIQGKKEKSTRYVSQNNVRIC
jgi:hypothetical protein